MKEIIVGMLLLIMSNVVAFAAPIASFNHFESSETPSAQEVSVPEDGYFEVVISNTCPDHFKYSNKGYINKLQEPKLPPPSGDDFRAMSFDDSTITDVLKENGYAAGMCVIHEGKDPVVIQLPNNKFNGYHVFVESPSATVKAFLLKKDLTNGSFNAKKAALKGDANLDDVKRKQMLADFVKENTSVRDLGNQIYTVSINSKGWRIAFSGGFTISGITDRKYALASSDNSTPSDVSDDYRYAYRDKNAEDAVSLGVAAFVHPYYSEWPSRDFQISPLSLGLGLNNSTGLSYFVGPSLSFGGKFFLTLGANFGPQKVVPRGVNLGEKYPVSDPNILNSLETRITWAPFIALSYSFINTGENVFRSAVENLVPK